ncbi:type II toxin-antitoxin system RelE/ParE family toxin [Microbaculum marinum]|uniref:Type II toxin-antitoxin system RelE/ParE family toxin n=1 Tax=Microbaculum marinum TaxID=1764581 RepID=A0AAW9RRY3_9HYPH
MRVRWTPTAARHVVSIGDFIASDSPRAAHAVLSAIRNGAERLSSYPTIGRRGRIADTRELVIASTPYIVVYRLGANTIDILAIIHASRDWPKSF